MPFNAIPSATVDRLDLPSRQRRMQRLFLLASAGLAMLVLSSGEAQANAFKYTGRSYDGGYCQNLEKGSAKRANLDAMTRMWHNNSSTKYCGFYDASTFCAGRFFNINTDHVGTMKVAKLARDYGNSIRSTNFTSNGKKIYQSETWAGDNYTGRSTFRNFSRDIVNPGYRIRSFNMKVICNDE